MAGLDVLSDALEVGNIIAQTPNPKGTAAQDNSGNAAASFAKVLGGKLDPTSKSKGHSSSIAGRDMAERKTAQDRDQDTQHSNRTGMQGYGNYVLPFLAQLTLQSDLPADKEANSEKDAGQGIGNLTAAELTLTKAMLKLITQAEDGVSAVKPQGDNLSLAELDKYKQVIAKLLEKLSGEITDISSKIPANLAGTGTTDLSQEMAKVVQGWLSLMDSSSETAPALGPKAEDIGQSAGIQTGLEALLTALDPKLSQGKESAGGINSFQKTRPILLQDEEGISDPSFVRSLASLLTHLKGSDQNSTAAQVKDAALLTRVQEKAEGISSSKGDGTQSSDVSGGKDSQNQNFSSVLGIVNNLVSANTDEGKTTAVPLWQQVSYALRDQIMNRPQDIKQLDIQLQPADLGKIQIDLRWENGQVHLQVQASQAATGQLLQNQLPDLRQALTNQGVNCGMLQMGLGGQGHQNSQGGGAAKTLKQAAGSADEENLDSIPAINSLIPGEEGVSQINVTA